MKSFKNLSYSAILGTSLGFLSRLFGGLDTLFFSVVLVLILDMATGLCAAAIAGVLSSRVGWSGLMRKVLVLFCIALGASADSLLHLDGLLRNALCLFYIGNESLSILENLEKAGVPFPNFIRRLFLQMKKEAEQEEKSLPK